MNLPMYLIRPTFWGSLTTAISVLGIVNLEPMDSFRSHSTAQTPALAPYTETLPGSVVKIQMVPVQGGTMTVGAQTVTVKPYYIATTESPWEAFDAFVASGPPSKAYDQTKFAPDAIARPSKSYILPDLGWGHNGYPAINLSFTSVEMFCRWLSAKTGKKYRVPTEAEWEMACRAGDTGPWQPEKEAFSKMAWYSGNSGDVTHPVGKKAPNKWGLFDMLGNTGEWCTDLEGKPILCGGSFRDSMAKNGPDRRSKFAPSWQETDPQLPKSRWWLSDAPFCGFRLVCEP